MAFRFIHTADWQLGMQASHVADAAEKVRQERLRTARRIIDFAREREVAFILVAGDLFESNGVGNDLVYRALHILEEAAPIPVYILPGNHDYLNPSSVYEREPFAHLPSHITVFRSRDPYYVLDGQVALLPAPLTRKHSEHDPTDQFPSTHEASIRIGVAHGSPRIPNKYQPDDHPIALNAAEKAGLDYLALGHWHSWFQPDERTVMPGTPEPSGFNEESGYIALVELDRGFPPVVERIHVGGLRWIERRETVGEDTRFLRARVEEWGRQLESPENTLLRLIIDGYASPEVYMLLDDLAQWMSANFLFSEIDTSQVRPLVSIGRLRELGERHPFVGGVLSDLAKVALLVNPDEPLADGKLELGETLPNESLRQVLAQLEQMDSEVVREALRQLGRIVMEVKP